MCKDWIEDNNQENGNYTCLCVFCQEEFVGYKWRAVCKLCTRSRSIVRFDVLPRLAVILESSSYKLKQPDGTIVFENGARWNFHVLNGLVKPEELNLFNIDVLNDMILRRYAEEVTTEPSRAIKVKWTKEFENNFVYTLLK